MVGGTPALPLAKAVILWLTFINALLWGREEIGFSAMNGFELWDS